MNSDEKRSRFQQSAELPKIVSSECSLTSRWGNDPGAPCSSAELISDVAASLGLVGIARAPGPQQRTADLAEVIEAAKKKTGCSTERCVLERLAESGVLGRRRVSGELERRFKVPGPLDTTLLSNINIDSVMQQWAAAFAGFFAYEFNMRDYHKFSFRNGRVVAEPDTLATVTWADIKAAAGSHPPCAACIINSDRYSGPGQHWMALFLDGRRLGSADARSAEREADAAATVEYFNSAGTAAAPEWVSWLTKMKLQLEDSGDFPGGVRIVRAVSRRFQHSRSECGLYSLYYVWSRLCGVRPEAWGMRQRIADEKMFEFRAHLFHDERRPMPESAPFDLQKYIATTRITWEPGLGFAG